MNDKRTYNNNIIMYIIHITTHSYEYTSTILFLKNLIWSSIIV